jgi:hypothetical protein
VKPVASPLLASRPFACAPEIESHCACDVDLNAFKRERERERERECARGGVDTTRWSE